MRNLLRRLFKRKQPTCPVCQKQLPPRSPNARRPRLFCSDKCRKKAQRRRQKGNIVTPRSRNTRHFRDLSVRVEALEKDREEVWQAIGSIMDLVESGEEAE